MAKSLFEEMGGRYERQGDYLIPCLTVPTEEEQAIGIWGQRHLDYLKQYHKVTYTNLLIHFSRAIRSSMHGFITLEEAGFFSDETDIDESYSKMIQSVIALLELKKNRQEPKIMNNT